MSLWCACCAVVTFATTLVPARAALPSYTVVGCDGEPLAGKIWISVHFGLTTGGAAAPGSQRVQVFVDGAWRIPRVEGTKLIVCDPATIGRVTVATGTAASLHELPVAASVLPRAALARTPALTTDSLLQTLPGFDPVRSNSAFTNYGQLRVSLNGSGNDRGSLLVDDVPGQDGFGGQVDWQAYAPNEIASAENLRGPGSALYGSGAIGGTLSLHTYGPPPAGASPEGDFAYAVGSRALRTFSGRYAAGVVPHLGLSASFDERHEAYLDIPLDQGAPIDQDAVATESTLHLRARYDAGSAALSFGTTQAFDDQEGGRPNYRFGRTYGQEDAGFDVPAGGSELHLGAFARDTAIVNVADQLPAKPGVLRYIQNVGAHEDGLGARWIGPSASVRFAAIADLRLVRGESQQFGPTGATQADAGGRQRKFGVALQATYTRPRFELLTGLRADGVDQFSETTLHVPLTPRSDRVLSPRAAVRYDLTRSLAVRVSGGSGFRAPYLNELLRGFQIGAVVMAPNPNLIPERSSALSAGLDLAVGRGRVSLDATRSYVNDAIMFVTLSPTLQQRANVASTRTDGVTADYTQAVSRCVDVRAFATGQHARVVAGPAADVGKQLAFVPNAIAGVGFDGRSGASALDVTVAYAGPAYADDLQAQPLGTAVLASARLSADFAGATLSLYGDNMSDARYRSSIDRYGPPSQFGIRVTVPLGPRSAAYVERCTRN